MTTVDINLRREVLIEDLKRELANSHHDFPYDRIMAGDWKVVIDALFAKLPENSRDDDYSERSTSRAWAVVRLANHAQSCRGEESLALPLLMKANATGRFWLSVSLQMALFTTVAMTRPLDQQEVDQLIRGFVTGRFNYDSLRSVAERGYAPSLKAERELLNTCVVEARLLAIRQIQPFWHAMRLRAEMSKLTPAKASESEAHRVPGL